MHTTIRTSLWELAFALGDAIDLVSPAVAAHHRQVARIAYELGRRLGWSNEELSHLTIAGALHDAGILQLAERIDLLEFEVEYPHLHATRGHQLLHLFEPLCQIATWIRYHHVPWNHGDGARWLGAPVPTASHLLHLADRIAVSLDATSEPLGQTRDISARIRDHSGEMFMPEFVEAFLTLAGEKWFWLDVIHSTWPSTRAMLLMDLDTEGLLAFAKLFSHVIDFRSRFTATHSAGVATVAESLAHLHGLPGSESLEMRVAGYFHDLGKLAIPAEILEKPAKLTREESNRMRSHTYFTHRILANIPALDRINAWGAYHHERLDGSGYPFHLTEQDMSLGSRIMAVSDVYTALTEDRPYRAGMSSAQALGIVDAMADNSALDGGVVAQLRRNADFVNSRREEAQREAAAEYRVFSLQCATSMVDDSGTNRSV